MINILLELWFTCRHIISKL